MIRSFIKDLEKIILECPKEKALTSLCPDNEVSEKNISYSDLSELIKRANRFYKQNNLSNGDDILILLPNSIELAVLYLASVYYGLNFIPLACEVTQSDIERIFKIAKPKLCVISELVYLKLGKYIESNNLNTIAIKTDIEFNWLSDTKLHIEDDRTSKTYIPTSGTTGEPKIIVINNNALWSSGYEFLKYHNLDNSKLRFWNYLPMSYLGGLFNLLIIPLVSKGSSVITETFSGKTFLSFWQTIERFDINALWFTPSIVKGLSMLGSRISKDMRNKFAENIKASFIGTAPISLSEKQKFEKIFNLTLFENFALSETTFFTSENINSIEKRQENSVGEILPYVDLKFEKISDEINEIKVKTPFLFDGYLQENGNLEPNIDDDGYFHTGDLGYLNQNKTLIIQGRSRDIIKKGGYFIQLREIELLAEKNPSVKEACATKIAHDFYGESYNLYVITEDAAENINQWIFDNLVKYKWPENIIIKKEFPKTPSGKIKKELLSE